MMITPWIRTFLLAAMVLFSPGAIGRGQANYTTTLNIPYCTVEGKTLTLNAFLPANPTKPAPAIVEIHGGWFMAGEPLTSIGGPFTTKGIAVFSIVYRLGDQGGFPECVRDCRNAVRFVRKNAKRFGIDPNRIACAGGSAGGHLSLMVAMVPENFDDGGPTPELRGVSAKVCGVFAWIAPTDLPRFWDQGPDDVIVKPDGSHAFRPIADVVPNDARPHLRSLFHGIAPDSRNGKELYTRMSPIGHVRKNLPPLLICDGEKDPIVPGLECKELQTKLKSAGADSTYWITLGGGHGYPGGPGFETVLEPFLDKIFRRG